MFPKILLTPILLISSTFLATKKIYSQSSTTSKDCSKKDEEIKSADQVLGDYYRGIYALSLGSCQKKDYSNTPITTTSCNTPGGVIPLEAMSEIIYASKAIEQNNQMIFENFKNLHNKKLLQNVGEVAVVENAKQIIMNELSFNEKLSPEDFFINGSLNGQKISDYFSKKLIEFCKEKNKSNHLDSSSGLIRSNIDNTLPLECKELKNKFGDLKKTPLSHNMMYAFEKAAHEINGIFQKMAPKISLKEQLFTPTERGSSPKMLVQIKNYVDKFNSECKDFQSHLSLFKNLVNGSENTELNTPTRLDALIAYSQFNEIRTPMMPENLENDSVPVLMKSLKSKLTNDDWVTYAHQIKDYFYYESGKENDHRFLKYKGRGNCYILSDQEKKDCEFYLVNKGNFTSEAHFKNAIDNFINSKKNLENSFLKHNKELKSSKNYILPFLLTSINRDDYPMIDYSRSSLENCSTTEKKRLI